MKQLSFQTTELHDLAQRTIPRSELRERGYVPVSKYADLHPYGYQIVAWVNASELRKAIDANTKMGPEGLLYEMVPRPGDPRNKRGLSHLPRVTFTDPEDQRRFHRAIGLNRGHQLKLEGIRCQESN